MTQQRPEAGTVPGLPNLHSHAFQRAMAGLTERRGAESDSFWTWREQMYRFVEPLSPGRLRRKAGVGGAAPLPERPRLLRAHHGDQGARRPHRHRPALATRRDARRPHMGRRDLARPAGPHPCQRADARGRGLPRRARPPADRSAARYRRGRRPLVPRPRHPCRQSRTCTHRQGAGRRRPLPDHRGQSRGRPVRRAGLPRPKWPLRRRLRLQRAHLRGRRVAHPRIRPAPDPSPAQLLGAANQSTGRRLFDAALASGRQAVGADDDATVTLDSSIDDWLFSADNTAIVSVERSGTRLVEHGRHRDRDRVAARYRKTLARLLA